MGYIQSAVLIILLAIAARYYFKKSGPEPQTFGSCDPKFKAVQEAFNENYRTGYERGSAFSLYHKGQKVCDLYGGFQDDDSGYPWQEDTMSLFFSATKGVSAICLLMLEDRGLIDYSQPVSKYWPEFAQNGKGHITVQQLLSHQAGLAALDEDISYKMIAEDVDTLGNILAKQAPNWTPGTMHGYHGLTFALYVEQLVMRVDPKHRRLNQFFHEEIAKPFDIDFYIGAPKEEHYRIASFIPFNPISGLLGTIQDWENFRALWGLLFSPEKVQKRAFNNPASPPDCPNPDICHNWPTLRACPMGSVYGYGTARGMAKLYGVIANGGSHNGKTLLSKRSLPRLTETVVSGKDRIMMLNITWGNGFMFLDGFEDTRLFGHLGFGGQVGLGNMNQNIGMGYVTIVPSATLGDKDIRFSRLKKALIDSLKQL